MISEVAQLLRNPKVAPHPKLKAQILTQALPKILFKVNIYLKTACRTRLCESVLFGNLCLLVLESQHLTNFLAELQALTSLLIGIALRAMQKGNSWFADQVTQIELLDQAIADRLCERTLLSVLHQNSPLTVQVVALKSQLDHTFISFLLLQPTAKLQSNFVPVWLFKWLREGIVAASEEGLTQLNRAFELVDQCKLAYGGYSKLTALSLCTMHLKQLIAQSQGALNAKAIQVAEQRCLSIKLSEL